MVHYGLANWAGGVAETLGAELRGRGDWLSAAVIPRMQMPS